MHKYTLAFLIKENKVLLLNRYHKPWMGSWNGVGGKIEENEQIFNSVIREIKEETTLDVKHSMVKYCGTVTWDEFDANGTGLYLFICNLPDDMDVHTPKVTDEGILDWKTLDWINDKQNTGIADNIPYFLNHAIKSHEPHEYYCKFEKNQLIEVIIKNGDKS